MVFSSRVQLAVLFLAHAALADGARDAVQAKPRPTKEQWEAGKAAEAEKQAAKDAKEAKMAGVNKVMSLLEELRTKVLHEGESEAATYNKFACFCKDTTKEKSAAIKKGEGDKAILTSTIEDLEAKRNFLDEKIQTLMDEIASLKKAMEKADAKRAEELKLYETNAADLTAALDALKGAIETVKASKAPSMAQLRALSRATALADALGLGGAAAKSVDAAFLQQAPAVPMEDYKFHSGGIIETLEMLLKSFRAEKEDLDKAEVESVKLHTEFIQEKTRLAQQKDQQVQDHKKTRDETIEDIAEANKQLSTAAATLLADQEYLMELTEMCQNRAVTWDQRSKVRQAELATLTQVIGIIGSKVAEKTAASTIRFAQRGVSVRIARVLASSEANMEAVEAEAEAADAEPAALLQEASSRHRSLRGDKGLDAGRRAVADLLLRKGKQLRSTLLLSLAGQVGNDPFAKVKVLIQELIERLLDEASKEQDHKGWCDKATTDATQKRDYAAKEIKSLNGRMESLEALRDKLADELSDLAADIKELKASRKKAKEEREEESEENKETVATAEAGLKELDLAIAIITKFYLTAAKEKVELGLAQRGPADDAPDAGFEAGEAYTGAQGASGGIIGLMEVMKSDFERTISETKAAEAQAAEEYMKFLTETGKSLAEKQEATKARTLQKQAAEKKLSAASDALDAETEVLKQKIKELMELKPVCIDTGMSYADRVARREDEIASLEKALCILKAFEEYGPEGLADAC